MSRQIDMFGSGETRSVAPHLDPAIVGAVQTRWDIDRDHVGADEVGKYGNNREVPIVEVWNKSGEVIWAQQCTNDRQAAEIASAIERKLYANRQTDLFA